MVSVRYIAVLALVVLLLPGCTQQALKMEPSANTAASATRSNRIFNDRRVEEAAWRRVEQLSVTRCGTNHSSPPSKETAVAHSICVTRIIVDNVLPLAPFPEIILASRSEALRLAEDYAQGLLTQEGYARKSRERIANYKKTRRRLAEQQALKAAAAYWVGDRQS